MGKENTKSESHAKGVRGRRKKLREGALRKIHSAPNIAMIKPGKMNWAGHAV
jgi:hypothetical protein